MRAATDAPSPTPTVPAILVALALVACGGDDGAGGSETSAATAEAGTTGGPASTATTTGETYASETTATDSATTGESTTGTGSTGTTSTEPGPPVCDEGTTTGDGGEPPGPDYGHATVPPRMALADTFYTYDLRTSIGDCSTDSVFWRFDQGPADARLELDGTDVSLAPGEFHEHTQGGDARESARVAWSLAEPVEPGCHHFRVTWRAWLDCGLFDEGQWGPEVTQEWSVAVRENHWYSGDLHVHTQHSERGPEAGGVRDYLDRMVNEAQSDAGQDFGDRRLRSPRGRLHWLVFSDHTNNELEECGRNFAAWCEDGEDPNSATGRDVAREWTEQRGGDTLLVVGAEISNQFDGHFGFLPRNPYPGHPIYAPDYTEDATDYDHDAGFGPGVFRERWVDPNATNAEEIELIHEMGGLAIVNHESVPTFWIEYDWSSLEFDGLEVWNGGNRHDRYDDGAYHGDLDVNDITEDDLLEVELPEDDLVRSWVGLMKHHRWPVVLVGGSDVHDYTEVVCFDGPCDPTNQELGSPITTTWAERFVWTDGAQGVLDGLAAGRVVIHDRSNFIDLRVTDARGVERGIGDSVPVALGDTITLRAFGRVSDFKDGDNRVLLILGTRVDPDDRTVHVLYNSEDATHFVDALATKHHMRYIRPDSSFDRARDVVVDADLVGDTGEYVIWAQFVPWHNPIYLVGNGQDMAMTGAVRLTL